MVADILHYYLVQRNYERLEGDDNFYSNRRWAVSYYVHSDGRFEVGFHKSFSCRSREGYEYPTGYSWRYVDQFNTTNMVEFTARFEKWESTRVW